MSKANDFIIYSVILSFILALFAPMIYDVSTVNSSQTFASFKAIDNWNLFGSGETTHYQYYIEQNGPFYSSSWEEIYETSTSNFDSSFPVGVSFVIAIAWLIVLGCSLAFYVHPSIRNEKEVTGKHVLLSIIRSTALIVSIIGLIFWNYYAKNLVNEIRIQDTNGGFLEISNRVETGIAISFLIYMNIVSLIVSIANSYSIINRGLMNGNESFKIFRERKKELFLALNTIAIIGIVLMPITILAMVHKKNELYTLLSNAGDDQFHYALNNGNFFGFGATSLHLDSCSLGCVTRITAVNDWNSSISNQFPQFLAYITLFLLIAGVVTILYDLRLKLSENNILNNFKITITSYTLLAISIITSITIIAWGIIISDITHELTYRDELYQVQLGLGLGFYLVMALNLISLVVCSKIIYELREGKLLDKSEEMEEGREYEKKREVEEIISKTQISRYEITKAQIGSMAVAGGLILIATYEYFFLNVLALNFSYLQAQLALGFIGLFLFFKAFESPSISLVFKHSLVFAAGYNMIIAISIISQTSNFDAIFIYSMSMLIHMVAFMIFLTKLE